MSKTEIANVALEDLRGSGIFFYEKDFTRALTQRLQSESTCAGEEVQHSTARQIVLNLREKRLPHANERWPEVAIFAPARSSDLASS